MIKKIPLKFYFMSIILVTSILVISSFVSDVRNSTIAMASDLFKDSEWFFLDNKKMKVEQITEDETPLFIQTEEKIENKGKDTVTYGTATDTIYRYEIGGSRGANLDVTVRKFTNGDEFVSSTLDNPSKKEITVNLFQIEYNSSKFQLYRFDRYPIKKNPDDKENYNLSTYPTGLLRMENSEGLVGERMVGQAYRSKELEQRYDDGGESVMRELLAEEEAISLYSKGQDLYVFYTLASKGKDIVDTWYMDSDEKLFRSDENMNNWMIESASNYKKRNKWYTAEGPYNRMVSSTEPMPESYQGFGRNLLLVKENRALELFEKQGDRYFENLINNSFVNLEKFKGDQTYWETEVTSTYLKDLYGITAPFIDTRFNEQIALFYYNVGEKLKVPDYKKPLRNYADLLVSQKKQGNIIPVDQDSYYISDYFPVVEEQNQKTHSSMNHVLGGMNLLLIAYQEFNDPIYLETAKAIQTAIGKERDKWIRPNGDLWYKVDKDGNFVGEDYQHLTLEDLINSYRLWSEIDKSFLPVVEELIASKSGYLSVNNFGYTEEIKNGLEELNLTQYLPSGPMHMDAL
ncbi:S-layer homology domain-containing protein [Ureibacillus composti]|nr:S-layer homology domain-containing protein [Ureibacillus composti]